LVVQAPVAAEAPRQEEGQVGWWPAGAGAQLEERRSQTRTAPVRAQPEVARAAPEVGSWVAGPTAIVAAAEVGQEERRRRPPWAGEYPVGAAGTVLARAELELRSPWAGRA
jgi:hypothetical protein